MSTRKTQLLRRAAGNERSRTVAITREEKALRAFLENAGGAGGGIFPVVVEMIFGEDGTTFSSSKTFDEIGEALGNGLAPIMLLYQKFGEERFPCGNSSVCCLYYKDVYDDAVGWVSEMGYQFIMLENFPEDYFPISYVIMQDGQVESISNAGTSRLVISGNTGFIMQSGTPESQKKFRIQVFDDGTLKATALT